MNFAPIDFEVKRPKRKTGSPLTSRKKRYVPKPKKQRSVFNAWSGTIELYQDGEKIRSHTYNDKKVRNATVKEWERWIRNLYSKHTFWVHVIPKSRGNCGEV